MPKWILCTCLIMTAICRAQVELEVGTVETGPEGAFSVPVHIGPNSGPAVEGLSIRITYDPAVITVNGVDTATGLISGPDWLFAANPNEPGVVRLAAATSGALTAQGLLFHLTCTPVAVGQTTLAVTDVLLNEGQPAAVGLAGGVTVSLGNQVNIPDPAFKAHLVSRFDTDQDGEISLDEAAAVTGGIDCSGLGITSLEGIQHFTNVSLLYCANNQLTALPDLSNLTKLVHLFCNGNRLTSLPDLSGMTRLNRLFVYSNQLTSLPDLSNLHQLQRFYCMSNALTSLPDLSGLTSLIDFQAHYNQITELPDLSGLTSLQEFHIENNRLTQFPDISGLPQLQVLNCANNQLSQADCAAINAALDNGVRLTLNPQRDGTELTCPTCLEPVINTQPVGTSSCQGSDVVFAVTAEGTGPLSYQWRRNQAALSGETGATLTLTAITNANAGAYDCVVTNACGQVTSSAATLTVLNCSGGIDISPVTGLTTSEDGLVAAFEVVLTGAPIAPVTIGFDSQDASEAAVVPNQITFQTDDWFQRRTVLIKGLNDDQADADQTVTITTAPAVSDDPAYAGYDLEDLQVTNLDDDQPNRLILGLNGNSTGAAGATLAVPVKVGRTDAYNVTAYRFDLNYDPTVLTYQGYDRNGTLSAGWVVNEQNPGDGALQIGAFNSHPLEGQGVLLYLLFTVESQPLGTTSPLSLANGEWDNGYPLAVTVDGRFTVKDCSLGDLDGDRRPTQLDASLALMRVVNLVHDNYPVIDDACVDANCNNNLEGIDAMLISTAALDQTDVSCLDAATQTEDPAQLFLTLQDQTVAVDGAFETPLYLTGLNTDQRMYGFQFSLRYDPELIHLEDVQVQGSMTAGATVLDNASEPGKINVAGFQPAGFTGEGLFLTLKGHARGMMGETDLVFDHAGFDDGTPLVTVQSARITVRDELAPLSASAFMLAEQAKPAGPFAPKVIDPNPDDTFTFQVLEQPGRGSIFVNDEGFLWIPNGEALGLDLFRFLAMDRAGFTVEGDGRVLVLEPAFFQQREVWPRDSIMPLIDMINRADNATNPARVNR